MTNLSELIKNGGQPYPGIQAYRADRKLESDCVIDVAQPLVKVRAFPDGTEFFGLRDEVLVPRLGTHILMRDVASKILADIGRIGPYTAVDVGTGSGIGALYMEQALEDNADALVIATDINQEAINFAFMNFQNNRLRRPPLLMRTNLLAGITKHVEQVDFIFSNPPFAPTCSVPRNGFDPELAYDGGLDGLDFYRKLAQQARELLSPSGILLFQISPAAPLQELIAIAQANFPNAVIGIIGATEGSLKGKGPIGLLIGRQEHVELYANRGMVV